MPRLAYLLVALAASSAPVDSSKRPIVDFGVGAKRRESLSVDPAQGLS